MPKKFLSFGRHWFAKFSPSRPLVPPSTVDTAALRAAPVRYQLVDQLLPGKTALITGGGHNIGRAIALEMAQQGANIVVLDQDAAACDRLQPEITASGVTYRAFAIDITDAAAVTAMIATLTQEHIQIDILVNNVGVTPKLIGLDGLAGNHFRELFEINVFAPMALTHQIAQAMIQHQIPGVILFITSIHQSELSRWVAYSSSKAALKMAIRELAFDLSAHGIRVNGIAPGTVAADEQGTPPPHKPTPLGQQAIAPCYIGRAAVFLASDYFSRATTGSILTVDGGLSLYPYRAVQKPPTASSDP